MVGDEGIDGVEGVLATEIAPATRPRDQSGKFIREAARPEPMFGPRDIEGDPLTGDTRDGGEDPRLRAREREILNGQNQGTRRASSEETGEGGERSRANRTPERRDADADDGYELLDEDPENLAAIDESDATEGQELQGGERESDEGEKYEVIVDGEPVEVSLKEALAGYIRQATFHKRMSDLNTVQGNMEVDAGNLQKGWQIWHQAKQEYEEDLAALIPKEPDWDAEFAKDPRAAHANQKIYQTLYAKLAASRQARADRAVKDQEDADRRLQKYAVDGFAKFVSMHPKVFPDEPTLKKNIQSMRRTAMAAGFSELEVATVYDPRMLTILLKASKYDRMQSARPRAVDPSKGRTLTPGAATPIGNASRKGLDEAQRRLASSGKLDDAAAVFRRML